MTYPHDCFTFGALAGAGIVLVVTCLFGWAWIALIEGPNWTRTAGRVIAGWRRR